MDPLNVKTEEAVNIEAFYIKEELSGGTNAQQMVSLSRI